MVVTIHSVISLCLLDEDQIPEPVTYGVPCSSNLSFGLVWLRFLPEYSEVSPPLPAWLMLFFASESFPFPLTFYIHVVKFYPSFKFPVKC